MSEESKTNLITHFGSVGMDGPFFSRNGREGFGQPIPLGPGKGRGRSNQSTRSKNRRVSGEGVEDKKNLKKKGILVLC